MATLSTRTTNTQSRQNLKQNSAIIKKRSAVPTTRPAFGEIQNAQGLSRQNATTNIRKTVVSKQSMVPQQKPPLTQKDLVFKTTKMTLKSDSEAVTKPFPDIGKICIPDSPVAMVMGTPLKQSSNVFDLALKPNVEDIDENDTDNPQLCSEFVNDIYQYMLYLEAEYPIQSVYLKDTSLKPRMRCILVDWLIQVHHRFQLLQETLYLTVAILDRFLQVHPVSRAKLQLVGVTAMLIASKYEEMYAPEVNDYVYITDKAFTQAQILSMEILMLKTLDFNLGRPLPLHFLRRNSKAGQVDALQHTLAKYLMELSLVDYDMCHVPPSKLAAGALCLSLKLLDDFEWSATLEHYSTYSEDVLQPVVSHLAKNLQSASTNTYQHAVKSKYSSHKLMKVSEIEEVKLPLVSELAERTAWMKL